MIRAEAETLIGRPVEETFSAVVDFANYPAWMQACVRLTQTSPGALQRGSTLVYLHSTGGRQGEMSGVVVTLEAGRTLQLQFQDNMFDVMVGFETETVSNGTKVSHFIAITPKSFLGRTMSPLIRKGNAQQVEGNIERLRNRLTQSR